MATVAKRPNRTRPTMGTGGAEQTAKKIEKRKKKMQRRIPRRGVDY